VTVLWYRSKRAGYCDYQLLQEWDTQLSGWGEGEGWTTLFGPAEASETEHTLMVSV